MTMNEVNELKKRLVETTNFSEFQDYYFTNFIEKSDFKKLGRPLSAPRTNGILQMVMESYYQAQEARVVAVQGALIEIREASLIHGAFLVDGKLASVLYFTDIRVGMCSVAEDFFGGKTNHMRFSENLPKNSRAN